MAEIHLSHVAFVIVILLTILILFFAIPRIEYSYWFNRRICKVDLDPSVFDTGDIIMFKWDVPCYLLNDPKGLDRYWADSNCAGQHMVSTWMYYGFKSTNYSHVGVIVRINGKPYVWHLSPEIMTCDLTGVIDTGRPCFSNVKYINEYPGTPYLFKYRGKKPLRFNNIEEFKKRAGRMRYNYDFMNMTLTNGIHLRRLPPGAYSCADFTEEILKDMGLICEVSRNAGLDTIIAHINSLPYEKNSMLLRNKWYIDNYEPFENDLEFFKY